VSGLVANEILTNLYLNKDDLDLDKTKLFNGIVSSRPESRKMRKDPE
jgi:hypothetical protein